MEEASRGRSSSRSASRSPSRSASRASSVASNRSRSPEAHYAFAAVSASDERRGKRERSSDTSDARAADKKAAAPKKEKSWYEKVNSASRKRRSHAMEFFGSDSE